MKITQVIEFDKEKCQPMIILADDGVLYKRDATKNSVTWETLEDTCFPEPEYYSVALWPHDSGIYDSYGRNISIDSHSSKAEAEAVVDRLSKEGVGGVGIIFPVKAFVLNAEDAQFFTKPELYNTIRGARKNA